MRYSISFIVCFLCFISQLFILGGCADTPAPDNIEPVLILSDAESVTRTDATLHVKIEGGAEKLQFVRFRYGLTETMDLGSPSLSADSEIITSTVTSLTPGSTYFYSAEGGNDKAIIRSATKTFTTIPYNSPTLSQGMLLSSGPSGAVVGFSIESDGGSPVLTSGCVVENSSNGEQSRFPYNGSDESSSFRRLYISVDRKDCEYLIYPFASNAVGESIGNPVKFVPQNSIVLESPGLLSMMGDDFFGAETENVVISGLMNGDDFRFLRSRCGADPNSANANPTPPIHNLDIADVRIVEGGGSFDGSRYTVTDVVSTALFADCLSLQNVTLPITATTLEAEAFKRCSSLTTLTLPPFLSYFMPSSGCRELQRIEITAGNPNFISEEGVLFNATVSEILWFPPAKTGEYTLPSTVSKIGTETFRGSRLSSITFPSSLKEIGRGACAQSSLSGAILPDELENIPEAMFQGSGLLQSVTVGINTSYVGAYAFEGCPLTDLFMNCVYPPILSGDTFGNSASEIFSNCVLHVPTGLAAVYRNHSQWGKFKNIKADL